MNFSSDLAILYSEHVVTLTERGRELLNAHRAGRLVPENVSSETGAARRTVTHASRHRAGYSASGRETSGIHAATSRSPGTRSA